MANFSAAFVIAASGKLTAHHEVWKGVPLRMRSAWAQHREHEYGEIEKRAREKVDPPTTLR